MRLPQFLGLIVVIVSMLVASGGGGGESNERPPSPSKSDDVATAQLREQFLHMMAVRAKAMSAAELRDAIEQANRDAVQRREAAAQAELGKAIGQLAALVRGNDGTEAATKAKEALSALGYTVWHKGKVYPTGTVIISDIPIVR